MKTDNEKKAYVDAHITKIYKQLRVNMHKVCGVNVHKWGDDLLALSLEFFLNKPLDVQYDSCINNKAEHFITKIANSQLKLGKTTAFYHKYRKQMGRNREFYPDYDYGSDYTTTQGELDQEKSLLEKCIQCEVNKLRPYEKMIIQKRIMYGYTYTEIAEEYNIPPASIAQDVKKQLKILHKLCKKYLQTL